MHSLEATTRNIRVSVKAEYDAGRSSPDRNHWFFLYTVHYQRRIAHRSARQPPLGDHRRHGQGAGSSRPGSRGESAGFSAWQSFEYTSGCPLTVPFGSMHGTYQMIDDRNEHFDVEIAPFVLAEPQTRVN